MEQFPFTSNKIAKMLAGRLKKLRLSKKWKRTTLAERSGVSVSSLIRFEQKAQISFGSFLKLLNALGRLDEVEKLLYPPHFLPKSHRRLFYKVLNSMTNRQYLH